MNRPRKITRLVLIAALVTIIVIVLFPAVGGPKEHPGKPAARSGVSQCVAALKAYYTEYGEPLTGSPSHVMTVLRGENPRKIVFFDAHADEFTTQGEYLDPWHTPYRFDLSDPKNPRVWSCGPNRKDEAGAEGSDDIVSWR